MPILRSNTAAVVMLAVASGILASATASGQGLSASEAFADGNRLHREQLYWAALLRYEEAADAGMETTLLHYNVGVTHYRARQYDRAMAAFDKASASPQLALLARYNHGLAAYAAGDRQTALSKLRLIRDQDENPTLSRLASKAIDDIRSSVVLVETEEPVVEIEETVRELDREPRKFAEYSVYASAGFGSDDNVYRTPGESYTDLRDPDQPVVVDPVVQSGSFVPVRLGAIYMINSFEHESFFARYRGFGRFYSGEELVNGDEYIQELAVGTEYRKTREKRDNRVFSAFTIAQHDETFFDPDDGNAQVVDDVDISDRYSYLRYGPELSTRQSWDRFAFEFRGKAQLWNYEDTGAVPEYDHEFFQVGTTLQYRFTKTSMIRLMADGYMRNFSDRPSFSLDGSQEITNPSVEYTYIDYGILARQRLTAGLWFGVSYVFTERSDQYVGYNDYTRDGFGAEIHMELGDNFTLDVEGLYRIYNFANAFAFHNPDVDRKTMETATGRIAMRYRMPWNLQLVGDFNYSEVSSNDTRIAFDRSMFMLSLEWNHQ